MTTQTVSRGSGNFVIPVREFSSVEELRAHQAALRAKFFPQPARPVLSETEAAAVLDAETRAKSKARRERELARERKRKQIANNRKVWEPVIVVAPDPSGLSALLSQFRSTYVSGPGEDAETVDRDRVRIARHLVSMIAGKHGVTYDDIMGERRFAPILAGRHEAIVLVAQNLPCWSLPRIGKFFGKDHTTVLHALRKAGIRQTPSSKLNRSRKTAP